MRSHGGGSKMAVAEEMLRWEPDLTSRRVDRQRIEDIAFTPMSTRLRNELITRTYGDISQQFDEILGRDDVTWAGFGQWASSTVGGFLKLPIPGLGRVIGRAFADGNRDVFADIARAHAVFLDTVGRAFHAGEDIDAAWKKCERRLQEQLFDPPGEPRNDPDRDGWFSTVDPRLPTLEEAPPNHLLIFGMRAYYRAITTPTPADRSRSILHGNCLLALHEQRVLALALSAGFRGWLRTILTFWRFFENRVTWRNREPKAWRLRAEHWWIRTATKYLVSVQLPTERVRCGKPVPAGPDPVPLLDMPAIDAHRVPGPLSLENLSDEKGLFVVFDRFEVDGRAATCWNDLKDRMAFILSLFAEHQRSPTWRDESGKPIRPKKWKKFDRELAKTMARIGSASAAGEQTARPSPVDEARLSKLRDMPTHRDVSHVVDLGLNTNLHREHARRVRTDRPLHELGTIDDEVAARYLAISRPGGLLDSKTRAAAQSVYAQWQTLCFLGLLIRSLPDSYTAGAGVEVLGRISDLATNPFRRAGETAQFVDDLLGENAGWTDGAPDRDAPGYASVLGVRKIHSLVSNRLLQDGWAKETLGLPINQEDALGAALTFGVSSVELMDRLDPSLLSDEQRDAYTRFWLGVGHLMGAPIDVLTVDDDAHAEAFGGPAGAPREIVGPERPRRPLTFSEAQGVSQLIRRRHRFRTLSGVRLTEALIEGISDGFPRPMFWLAPGLMEALGEPQVTSMLLAGTGTGRRRAQIVSKLFKFALRARGVRVITRRLIGVIGRWWLMPFLEQGRTRPYRRPTGPSDEDRLELARLDASRWPVSCGAPPELDEPPAPQAA